MPAAAKRVPPPVSAPTTDPAATPASAARRTLMRRMWRDYLYPHRFRMLLAFLVMTVEGSSLAVLSYMLEPLFDHVFAGGNSDAIWWVGGVILSMFILRAATAVSTRAILARISQLTATRMQSDLMRQILRLDGAFFQTHPPGALIERVQGDTAAVQGIWSALVTGGGRDVIALCALFAVATSIDPVWTAAAMIGAPILVLPAIIVQRYVRRKSLHVRAQAGLRATRLDEVFHGINAVKLNRLEDYQQRRFERIVDTIVRAEVKSAASRAAMPALVDITTGIGFFFVLLLGGRDVIAGTRTVGEFMSFFTAMTLAFQPLRRLGDLAGSWQIAAASLTRIYDLLDHPVPRVDPARLLPPPSGPLDIRFDGVAVSFGDHLVLDGLSFSAAAGQTTAIVGPSGAGKSTIFSLLTRLVEPDDGVITVGGTDTARMDLSALRDLFSVVSQDSSLFDETIGENILLGRTDIAPDRLAAAMKAAHVDEFVAALPQGVDSRAGPRGSALSGGQRQRVSIARAILRDAPILLLDE